MAVAVTVAVAVAVGGGDDEGAHARGANVRVRLGVVSRLEEVRRHEFATDRADLVDDGWDCIAGRGVVLRVRVVGALDVEAEGRGVLRFELGDGFPGRLRVGPSGGEICVVLIL